MSLATNASSTGTKNSKNSNDFALSKKRNKKEVRKSIAKKKINRNNNDSPVYEADSLGCISTDNFFRRNAIKLVHSQEPFIFQRKCTLRNCCCLLCVKCGVVPPKRIEKVTNFHDLMTDKPKPPTLDRTMSCLWTFDRTIILLIMMNCLFLAITAPFPTCCRDGTLESKGESMELITASFFAIDLSTIQTNNAGGLGSSMPMMDLLKQPSGNNTAVRCVMGGETMSNILEHRPELIEGDSNAIVWSQTTIPCCVDRTAEGIVPMPEGVDIPISCADYDASYTGFVFNWIFTICFFVEMCIQVLARGWCGDKPNKKKRMPGSYCTSGWFILDFFVVCVSFLSEIPGVGNISALRTFRVLRPLRTLTAIPSMRALINSLFKSLPNMQYVVMMMFFLPIVFGVVAVQLWGGLLRSQCMYLDNSTQSWIPDEFQEGRMCGMKNLPLTPELYNNETRTNPYYALGRVCSDRLYGNDSWTIAAGTMDCRADKNPNYGQTHFEMIGVAMLWIFADITLEGWVDNMYMINDAFAYNSEIAIFCVNVYFTLLVLLGGFFMLNLALAVVWDNYQRESSLAEAAIAEAEKFKQMERDRNILFRWKAKAHYKRKRRESLAPSLFGGDADDLSARVLAELESDERDERNEDFHGEEEEEEQDAANDEDEDGEEVDYAAHQRLSTAFDKFDTDESGHIDESELQELMNHLGIQKTQKEIDQLVKEVDADNDGEISYSEFEKMINLLKDDHAEDKKEDGGKDGGIVVGSPNVTRKSNAIQKPPPAFGSDGTPTGFTMGSETGGEISIFQMVTNHKNSEKERKSQIWKRTCAGKIQNLITLLVLSTPFFVFITTCIIANVIFMAMDYSTPGTNYHTPDEYIQGLYWANETCSIIFFLEMCLKLIGIGWTEYSKDEFNLFDMAIVCFSVFEWLLLLTDGGIAVGGLSVFRLFRVMRILKLAKSWKDLNKLIRLIALSIGDVTSAAALLLVIMFIFSMIGMQLFGGRWNAELFLPDDPPRANFDSFGWSLVTVFQVLSGENWNDVLWAGMKGSGAMAAVYFLALNIGGGFIILNLFLAILLARFEGSDDGSDEDKEIERLRLLGLEEEKTQEEKTREQTGKKTPSRVFSMIEAKRTEKTTENTTTDTTFSNGNNNTDDDSGNKNKSTKVHPSPTKSTSKNAILRSNTGELDINRMTLPRQDGSNARGLGRVRSRAGKDTAIMTFGSMIEAPPEQDDLEEKMEMSGTSLGLMDSKNSFRSLVFGIISNKKFEGFILMLIAVSSLMLAMDEPWVEVCACFDPADPSTHYEACDTELNGQLFNAALGAVPGNSRPYLNFLIYGDLIITIIFVIEMTLKLIGLGIWRSKTAYFRSSWNTLDFFIVIVSVTGLVIGPLATGICTEAEGGGKGLKALRSMRALRALRPLRVVRRYPALRLVVSSIFRSMGAIINVLIVMTLFFMIFAIYGTQRWMGQMAKCNDGSVNIFAECKGDFILTGLDCQMLPTSKLTKLCILNGDNGMHFPRQWESMPANFDWVGNGFLTVFELASGEMWPDIMYYTVDAVAVNTSQIENWNRLEASIFHIGVQLVCSFLMVNVFIGVVIEKYNENKLLSQGAGMLTNKQKLWLESMKLALSGNAVRQDNPPKQKWRIPFFVFVKRPFFDGFIMFCIVANTVVLMCTSFDEGLEREAVLETMNAIFSYIFTVEFFLKFTGLGKQYFFTRWNCFDFVLVVLSWVGGFFSVGPVASLFRVFRVLRMVRLVRRFKGLLNLFKTLIFSLPALANISCIVVLFMFVFSCIAMNLFANVKLQDNLNEQANFKTFFRSFNTLWRYVSF